MGAFGAAKSTKKPEKRSGAVWLGYYAATSGSSRTNGSGYPFLCLAPPPFLWRFQGGRGKGEVKPPNSVQHATQGFWIRDMSEHDVEVNKIQPYRMTTSQI